jgi:hypothetical protein
MTDIRNITGLSFNAPEARGAYRYRVSARWLDRSVTSNTSGYWFFQIRVR